MGVVASSVYQEGLALKANSADVIASSNAIGLNDVLADALSLSGVPVGGAGTAGSQSVAGPVTFNGVITFNSAQLAEVSVLTSGSTYAITASDRYVVVNQSAAMTLSLPVSPVQGRLISVKDGIGTAASFNITITGSQNIDNIVGATGLVLNSNYASVDLLYSGAKWSIL